MKPIIDTSIERIIRIYKRGDEPPQIEDWRDRSMVERLAALEEIRHEYHQWKFGHKPRFERVITFVKFP